MKVVYRKFQNGKEFLKIMDETWLLSVLVGSPFRTIKTSGRISITSNPLMIQSALDDHVSMPSTEAEFQKAYDEAITAITRFSNIKQA